MKIEDLIQIKTFIKRLIIYFMFFTCKFLEFHTALIRSIFSLKANYIDTNK